MYDALNDQNLAELLQTLKVLADKVEKFTCFHNVTQNGCKSQVGSNSYAPNLGEFGGEIMNIRALIQYRKAVVAAQRYYDDNVSGSNYKKAIMDNIKNYNTFFDLENRAENSLRVGVIHNFHIRK